MGRIGVLVVVALAAAAFGGARSAAADEPVQSNPQPAPSQGESNPHSAPGSPPVVEKVNREAQSFGERLNANIVGQRQQNENDWKAAHPIEAARQEGGPLAPPP